MAKKNRAELLATATRVIGLLNDNSRITIKRIARELGTTERNARRWVDALSGCCDLRVEAGVVISEYQKEEI